MKRRAHRLYLKTRTDENRHLYQKMQQEAKAATSLFKDRKYAKLTENIQNLGQTNPKEFWHKISKLRGKKSYTKHPIKNGNNVVLFDDAAKAEAFRDRLQEICRVPMSQII